MDQCHLLWSKIVGLPVDQVLQHRELLQQILFSLEPLRIHLFQILSKQIVVQLASCSLTWPQIQHGTTNREQILVNVLSSKILRNDGQIALMILEQNLHLPIVLIVFIIVIWFLRDILVNEMKLLERIQKIEISIALLALIDHRIEFLEKEPDKVSIRFIIYVLQN